ncbi:MAG: cytochrome ubiquinol oxidase subunit I [bacterium]
MDDLLAARSQMAMSLAFHIIFAAIGIAMPLLMVLAEAQWLRTKDKIYLELAKRWAKGTAIMFAVGAVSGTVLSFELGLLWPTFMEHAGPVIGMPFSMEGFAFFLEAIFLGIYLYGWEKVSPVKHLLAGVMVAISGTMSGIFVVTANAWMNTPAGFEVVEGKFTNIDPWAAMFNPAALTQTMHMTFAAFAAVGFAVAGIHAGFLLKDKANAFHRTALKVALWVAVPAAFLMPLSGDLSAKHVAEYQPVKLAAMEGHWDTERGAALHIGGWPDEEAETTRWSIDIPYGLSFLAFADPNAEVKGLKDFPRDERPPVAITHVAFQIMVGAGFAMMGLGAWVAFLGWRRKALPTDDLVLKALVAATPLGFIAVEAGWTVTEVGRQPWVVHGIMRTADAVTPMPHLVVPFTLFSVLYFFLAIMVVYLMRRIVFMSPEREAEVRTLEVAHAE